MKKVSFLLLCLVLIGGVSACGDTIEPNENPDQVFTDVSETAIAEITQEAIVQVDHTQIAETVVAAMTQTTEADATQTPTDEPIEVLLCSASMDTLSQKFSEWNSTSGHLYNYAYVADIRAAIDDFKLYCTNFYDENAPAEFTELNNTLNEFDENYIQAYDHLRSAFRTRDTKLLTKLLQESSDYMRAATEKMHEAAELLENMNQ